MLGPEIERLPDDRPREAQYFRTLGFLHGSIGNLDRKRLLTYTLELWRERGMRRPILPPNRS